MPFACWGGPDGCDLGSLRDLWPSRCVWGIDTLVHMNNERRLPNIRDIWRLILAIIGVVAIIKELRKPEEERTWHGKVGDVVPYDFRMPTFERIRDTYWNPGGPVLSGKAFGVGWAPNFGALTRLTGQTSEAESSDS